MVTFAQQLLLMVVDCGKMSTELYTLEMRVQSLCVSPVAAAGKLALEAFQDSPGNEYTQMYATTISGVVILC